MKVQSSSAIVGMVAYALILAARDARAPGKGASSPPPPDESSKEVPAPRRAASDGPSHVVVQICNA